MQVPIPFPFQNEYDTDQSDSGSTQFPAFKLRESQRIEFSEQGEHDNTHQPLCFRCFRLISTLTPRSTLAPASGCAITLMLQEKDGFDGGRAAVEWGLILGRIGRRARFMSVEELAMQLPRLEMLRLMESQWVDLSQAGDGGDSPALHEVALRETERRVSSGEEEVLDWEQAKRWLRRSWMKIRISASALVDNAWWCSEVHSTIDPTFHRSAPASDRKS